MVATLARDNSTRRNSWYTIIKVATSPAVKQAIDRYFAIHRDNECAEDELTSHDWVVLDQIKDILEHFEHVTRAFKGHTATIDETLPAMDFALEYLDGGWKREV
jgi:hypothetical protein